MEHQRHLDIFDPRSRNDVVSLIGMGGIGSFTAIGLAKLGIKTVHLWDKDLVEPHNVPVQLLPFSSVGSPKVDTVALLMHVFGDMDIVTEDEWDSKKRYSRPIVIPHNAWVDEDTELYGVVVSAVDSIKARREIFEAFMNSPSTTNIIDPRLGGEVFQIITIGKGLEDTDWYDDTQLPPDSTVPDTPCTAAAVIDVGFSVGAAVVNTLRKLLVGRPFPRNFRWDSYNNRYDELDCPT